MRIDKSRPSHNFIFGDVWCDVECRLGHQIRIINVGQNHYVVCDECKDYHWLGHDLSSGWKEQGEATSVANRKLLDEYAAIER